MEEAAPPACGVKIGSAILMIGDAQFRYSLGDNHVEILCVPLEEIPACAAGLCQMGRAEGRVPIMAGGRTGAVRFSTAALIRESRVRSEAMQKRYHDNISTARNACATEAGDVTELSIGHGNTRWIPEARVRACEVGSHTI